MAEEEKMEGGEETAEAQAEPETAEAEAEPAPAEEELPKLTAREIEKMNAPKLKEAALQYGGRITGVHGMDKAQLIRALKEINDIPLQEARQASKIDRQSVKQKIKALKRDRDGAIEDGNLLQLKRIRKRAKALRRKLVRYA